MKTQLLKFEKTIDQLRSELQIICKFELWQDDQSEKIFVEKSRQLLCLDKHRSTFWTKSQLYSKLYHLVNLANYNYW